MNKSRYAITGVLGYSGRYMAEEVMYQGGEVLGLTNTLNRPNPHQIRLEPLCWDDPSRLVRSLRGCDVLLNTYWVRFNHANFTHEQAVKNSLLLFRAAREAGVGRIVHVSITHPDMNSRLSYFRGKAELEEELVSLGIPCSILRPAVLFGEQPGEDILINNMAWVLRHFPVVPVFGNGDYRLRPIHVADLARLAVSEAEREDSGVRVVEAVGPDSFSFRELFAELGEALGVSRPVMSTPYWAIPLIHAATVLMGKWYGDVMLTRDEIAGLVENRLEADNSPSAGSISLRSWMKAHADVLGRKYASELSRR